MPAKRIPLVNPQTGTVVGHTKISTADFALLPADWTWRLNQSGYVIHSRTLLHRLLLGLEKGDPRQCDHINGDKLDNRRENLRIVTQAQNAQNRRSGHRGSASPFRGVLRTIDRHTPWLALVTFEGQIHRLGYFADEVAAARVVDAWRLEHMPFAEPDQALVEFDRKHAA